MDYIRYPPPKWPERKTPKWFLVLMWLFVFIIVVAFCQLLIELASMPPWPHDLDALPNASPVADRFDNLVEHAQNNANILAWGGSPRNSVPGLVSESSAGHRSAVKLGRLAIAMPQLSCETSIYTNQPLPVKVVS